MRITPKAPVAAIFLLLSLSLSPAGAQSSLVTRISGAQTRIDTRISLLTSDSITQSDCGKLISYSNASAIAVTLPVSTALLSGCWMDVQNTGAGTLTITPTSSTIDGGSSIVLTSNQGLRIVNTGNQYLTQRGQGSAGTASAAASASYSADGATVSLIGTTFSANTAVMATRAGNGGQAGGDSNVLITSGSQTAYVGAATGNPITVYTSGMRILVKVDVTTSGGAITLDAGAGPRTVYQNDGISTPTTIQWVAGQQILLSYDGTLNSSAGGWRILSGASSTSSISSSSGASTTSNGTQTIASGTAALGTSSIASGTCASAVTASASGIATSDVVIFTPTASLKAITGYTPSTTGGLAINAYPSSGAVVFDVCNWSSASITPGAVSLNWRVVR